MVVEATTKATTTSAAEMTKRSIDTLKSNS